jgi:protein-tyrosine phosphatase
MFSFMEKEDQSNECNAVIPGILYISGYKPANNLKIMKDLMIKRIVRLGDKKDFESLYITHENIEYHDIYIEDSVKSHFTKEILDNALLFIREAKGPVLVHCKAGISRSATIVIAYLMVYNNKSFRESRLFLKSKRELISPNSTFIKDLQKIYSIL